MQEQWSRWEPLPGLGEKYNIDYVSNSCINGFKIILFDYYDTKTKVEVFFDSGVAAYQEVDESYRLRLLVELRKAYDDEFYGFWTFFKVTNSSYAQWLSQASLNVYPPTNFFHFCFIANDTVLDVLANYEPVVRFVERDPGDRHE